jgi:hypothetical protein
MEERQWLQIICISLFWEKSDVDLSPLPPLPFPPSLCRESSQFKYAKFEINDIFELGTS